MGKSKKNKRKADKKVSVNQLGSAQKNAKLAAEKELLQKCIDNEDFSAALNQLADMVEEKVYDAEVLYQGAYCYFMLCDYDRAAGWLDNVLSMEPAHIRARLLLARLCVLEDRTRDGLAIYDFVLSNYGESLNAEQLDEIRDVLDYYAQHERDVLAEFPMLLKFMGEGADFEASECISAEPVCRQEDDAQPERGVSVADILAKPVSLREKLRILNAFAGGYFLQGDYSVAETYLLAAMKLDEHDDCTLKNLAVLYKTLGNQEMAIQVASTMEMTDFVLLERLK